jgi:hypothetical protein
MLEDIFPMILEWSENTLIWGKVSKKARALAFNCYAPLTLTQDERFMYRIGSVSIDHMKDVLRGVARLLRDHKFKIEDVHRSWSFRLYICKHHGDCGHQAGHLFDLLELRDLVLACPGFKLHRAGQAPETTYAYFTLIVQSYNADAWKIQLEVTRNPRRIVQEPFIPNIGFINGDFFE